MLEGAPPYYWFIVWFAQVGAIWINDPNHSFATGRKNFVTTDYPLMGASLIVGVRRVLPLQRDDKWMLPTDLVSYLIPRQTSLWSHDLLWVNDMEILTRKIWPCWRIAGEVYHIPLVTAAAGVSG